jgi:hypothetical protein
MYDAARRSDLAMVGVLDDCTDAPGSGNKMLRNAVQRFGARLKLLGLNGQQSRRKEPDRQ